MEQDNFEFVLDANSCEDDHTESSTANVEQTQASYTPTQPTQKDKQVQVEPCPENVRSFRSIGTQTGDVVNDTVTKLDPDDITKLCHLEDHTYSLGPNNCPSTDEFVVEPCLTACTPWSEDQPVSAESDVVQNEMIIDAANPASSDQADDALSDSGSLYCPSSVSDDESAADDEFSSCTAPSVEKNTLSLKVSFTNYSKIVSIADYDIQ